MLPVLIKGLIAVGGLSLGGVGIWQFSEYMAPKTLRQRLEGEGLTLRSFNDISLPEWKTMAQKHRSETGDAQSIKFEGLDITGTSGNDEDAKKLMNKCREVAGMSLGEDDEGRNIQRLRTWCFVTNTGINTIRSGTVETVIK